jgi:enterochelin esterase-like enzyme
MHPIRKLLVAAVLFLAPAAAVSPLRAQMPPAPRTSQLVHPDRSVTFRYIDTDATKMFLSLENTAQPLPMTKDAAGLWSVTTPPLAPGIYAYGFYHDGLQPRIDPYNPDVTGNVYFPARSSIEIPGPGPEPWDKTAVPHGEIHIHDYTTHIALGLDDNQSEYLVYTPPGYDPTAKKTYPVLYLLHGWSDMAVGWTAQGKANLILDNLIAQGKAKPMLVVMPLGYGDTAFLRDYGLWGDDAAIDHNLSLYSRVLLEEILPRIEAEYRVSKDRDDRAIAGLSMGGLEALSIGLAHTDTFAYIGGFSAAVHRDAFLKSLPVLTPASANLKLLWVACGTGDQLLAPNRKLAAYLKSQDLPVTAIHTWPVWRDNLIHFATLLFQ